MLFEDKEDSFKFHNAIAILTDKDYGWSTEVPASSCIAWKCVISRIEHVMKAETFLVEVNNFQPYVVRVGMISKGPIFNELHYLSEEEEGFWPKEPMCFYKVVEPPYTNMQALIQKVKENKDA